MLTGPQPPFLERDQSPQTHHRFADRVLKARQWDLCVTKTICLDADTLHEGQIQAAHLPIVVSGIQVIQSTPGLERTAEATRQD